MYVDLVGSNVRVNISAVEIRKLADIIIAESKEVHDAVASVPADKVTFLDFIFEFFVTLSVLSNNFLL